MFVRIYSSWRRGRMKHVISLEPLKGIIQGGLNPHSSSYKGEKKKVEVGKLQRRYRKVPFLIKNPYPGILLM
jgi:hypothetical protein